MLFTYTVDFNQIFFSKNKNFKIKKINYRFFKEYEILMQGLP